MNKEKLSNMTYQHPFFPEVLHDISTHYHMYYKMFDIINYMQCNPEVTYSEAILKIANELVYAGYIHIARINFARYIRDYNKEVKARHEK